MCPCGRPAHGCSAAIVFVTHHKTGTALIGCIVGSLTAHLDVFCQVCCAWLRAGGRSHELPCLPLGRLQHSATPVYVNNQLTAAAIGYYADLSRSAAFQRFGVVRGARLRS